MAAHFEDFLKSLNESEFLKTRDPELRDFLIGCFTSFTVELEKMHTILRQQFCQQDFFIRCYVSFLLVAYNDAIKEAGGINVDMRALEKRACEVFTTDWPRIEKEIFETMEVERKIKDVFKEDIFKQGGQERKD